MRYFKIEEFACHCGCGDMAMDSDFLVKLDRVRGLCAFPFHISSGKRCEAHNEKVGGAKTSQHLNGKAADIVTRGADAYRLVEVAKQMGFRGVGISQKGSHRFIHLDTRDGDFAFWSY